MLMIAFNPKIRASYSEMLLMQSKSNLYDKGVIKPLGEINIIHAPMSCIHFESSKNNVQGFSFSMEAHSS